eukprot:CAMPEP_0202823440 /NCGR_PEP_ID=MMETSP1389-20130828/11708_1 /ASSEMBLY_ACC=CAM_ASM_000865 /TAXON_ID=302021 /ORGANISM="Rhodomonas sp., Strain CCMP768" /LENGTH=236 /DNA_ID=CAMNT_0049496433 /DNA_START=179 /DNA_END=890 /DNA_ORIENTATION=-
MSLRTGSQKEASVSRKRFLEAVSSGVSATAFALSPVGALEAPESFTVAFNASKGSLGIGLQELRYPKKKAPWDSQKEVVTVSSVDPYGQGVKQDRRIRPGLVITSVQGRGVEGLSAKEVIKQLEDEMLARSAGDTRAAEDEGLPELVEITFSSKCVSVPEEPDFCFNSVQPLDSESGAETDPIPEHVITHCGKLRMVLAKLPDVCFLNVTKRNKTKCASDRDVDSWSFAHVGAPTT